MLRIRRAGSPAPTRGPLLEPDHRLAAPTPPGPAESSPRTPRQWPRGEPPGRAGRPSLSEVAKLRAENERLRAKLAQAEVVIDVQGKVHALLEEISKGADS